MASHHTPGKVVPLHRGIADQPRDYVEPARFVGPARHIEVHPGVLDRVAETLSAPRFILFYLGFYAGCMATVGLALLWSAL